MRNLVFDLREKHMTSAFRKFGKIIDVTVPLNPSTNQNRGFAFVEFETHDLAQRAVTELSNNSEFGLELQEYTEPPASRRSEERAKREQRPSVKQKQRPRAEAASAVKARRPNIDQNWRDLSRVTETVRSPAKEIVETTEDDIGYSSDNNEVIDSKEWKQLVDRTVAMVFEDV